MSTAMVSLTFEILRNSLHLIREVMGAIKKILKLENMLSMCFFLTSELKYAL